jgi:hypothetical protein
MSWMKQVGTPVRLVVEMRDRFDRHQFSELVEPVMVAYANAVAIQKIMYCTAGLVVISQKLMKAR